MGKVKLAICLDDAIYQERFVRCLMNHYKERYELHIFQRVLDLTQKELWECHGYILGEKAAEELHLSDEQKNTALIVDDENKYQEVYKLIEKLEVSLSGEKIATERSCIKRQDKTDCCIIGIYSFTLPHLQLPMAALLSGIYGSHGKAILLDFQSSSGFVKEDMLQEQNLGMEDLLAMAMGDSFHKGRCLSAIGHDSSWDYVHPVKSVKGLTELNSEMIRRVIRFLVEELEYDTVVINVGEGTIDIGEIMELCSQMYLLYPKGDTGSWREKSYVNEMERRGKDKILHRIHRIEIPSVAGADRSWESLVEQWKWNSIGDYLRKVIWGAGTDG